MGEINFDPEIIYTESAPEKRAMNNMTKTGLFLRDFI